MKAGEPLIIDEFLAGTYAFPKKIDPYRAMSRAARASVEQEMMGYRIAIRNAKGRFILDDAFTDMATRVANTVDSGKIMARIQGAALPFETTWLEFNLRQKVRTSIELSKEPGREVDPGVTQRLGVLLRRDPRRPTAWSMQLIGDMFFKDDAGTDKDSCVMAGPAVYLFDAMDGPALHMGRTAGFSPFNIQLVSDGQDLNPSELVAGMRAYGWGFTAELGSRVTKRTERATLGEVLQDSQLACTPRLMSHSQVAVPPYYLAELEHVQAVGEAIRGRRIGKHLQRWVLDYVYHLSENSGMLRWVVTVLNMLADVPVIHSEVKPSGSQRIGLSRKPLMEYHRVSLKLPKTRPLAFVQRKLKHADSRRHRAHDVRSHWRTYVSADRPTCRRVSPTEDGHTWTYDHENGYRLCGVCEAFGRLIAEHERGDPALGRVNKDYVLEVNPKVA